MKNSLILYFIFDIDKSIVPTVTPPPPLFDIITKKSKKQNKIW